MPQAVAPLFAARRRHAHWAFGVAPAQIPASLPDGGTGDLIGLKVELYLAGGWTDISTYVLYQNRVRITRGRPDETSQTQPQTCMLTLNNGDGRFSPRNPVGPWYGQLGRNTPIRISRLNNGIRRYRFYGEVPAWPMTSDISGRFVTVSITAAGMMRRLTQGTLPLRSPILRAFTLGYSSNQFFSNATPPLLPVAYWPCEDGSGSASIASGLAGGTPLTLSGQALPTFASNTSFACSASLPLLSASIWTGSIPAYTGGTANVLRFLLAVPSTGAFNTAVVASMYTSGTVARVDLTYSTGSSGSLQISGYNAAGSTLFANGYLLTGVNGKALMVSMELITSGANVNYQLTAMTLPTGAYSIYDQGTAAVGTIGKASQIVINVGGHINDTAIGHVAYQSGYDPLTNIGSGFLAYTSEPPVIRFARLCGEQNVPAVTRFVTSSSSGDPTLMGPQPIDTFPNMLQQASDALFVPIYEAADQLSLVMRSKGTMYNQAARLTLDMSAHQLSGPLVPVDDDALTRNDVTVSAINGSSAQVVQTTGPLSAAAFPAGVGDYSTNYSLSLYSTVSLADQAGWRLLFGTVNEPRYPQVPTNLRHPTFTSNVDLMNAALTIDVGDRIVINNPPAPDYPPDPISLIVQGYTETLGIYEHDVVFNCSPESPWRVAIADDPVLGRADTDGSTLAAAYGSTDTTLLVATTNASSPLWTTTDFPFDIAVGGERMTVTNVTGAASPQTFTVTRSVNGVVKTQTVNTDVRLWQPAVFSIS